MQQCDLRIFVKFINQCQKVTMIKQHISPSLDTSGDCPETQSKKNSMMLKKIQGSSKRLIERKNNGKLTKLLKNKSECNKLDAREEKHSCMEGSYIGTKLETLSYSTKNGTDFQPTQRFNDRREHLQCESVIKEETRSKSKRKRTVHEPSDYYKYWKQKAKEYQENNFNLDRLNASLKQENEFLKHQNQQLKKKIDKTFSADQSLTCQRKKLEAEMPALSSYKKMEECYKNKVSQLLDRIKEQSTLIQKQDKKIKELSKYLTQNSEMRSLLDNLQEKLQQKSSFQDSKTRISELSDLLKINQRVKKSHSSCFKQTNILQRFPSEISEIPHIFADDSISQERSMI